MHASNESLNETVIKQLSSIAIVIPYFGKWPFWMGFFVESCRANPTINWIIFTDCGELDACPDNLELTHISYSDYCKLVSQKLVITFQPKNPYKLCDIKPALGDIHAELLQSYDFWAFGDIDLVYGDLRSYFNEERLMRKDVFATHARRISGHLCLIRNTEELRTAYKRVDNWQALLTAQQHTAFDEKAFSKIFLRHKNSPQFVRAIAAWFDPWLQRAEFIEAYTTPHAKIEWIDGSTNYPRSWLWQNGVLTNSASGNKTFPYFHFMVWKRSWVSEYTTRVSVKDCRIFSITESGFKLIE